MKLREKKNKFIDEEMRKINDFTSEEDFEDVVMRLTLLKYKNPSKFFRVALMFSIDLQEMTINSDVCQRFGMALVKEMEYRQKSKKWDEIIEYFRFIQRKNEFATEIIDQYHVKKERTK